MQESNSVLIRTTPRATYKKKIRNNQIWHRNTAFNLTVTPLTITLNEYLVHSPLASTFNELDKYEKMKHITNK